MQIDGLILFKSSTNQAIASLYFLRISTSLCSLYSVKSVAIITGFDPSSPKKAYFKCLINSSKLTPHNFFQPSMLSLHYCLIFFAFSSFRLSIVSLHSKLVLRCSVSRSSIYWKFIIFSFIES